MRVVCASAKEETFFVAVENGPVKAIRLLKCLNKKKVKVTAGKAPKGEGKAGRPIVPECRGQSCRLPGQVAARPRLLGWTLPATWQGVPVFSSILLDLASWSRPSRSPVSLKLLGSCQIQSRLLTVECRVRATQSTKAAVTHPLISHELGTQRQHHGELCRHHSGELCAMSDSVLVNSHTLLLLVSSQPE